MFREKTVWKCSGLRTGPLFVVLSLAMFLRMVRFYSSHCTRKGNRKGAVGQSGPEDPGELHQSRVAVELPAESSERGKENRWCGEEGGKGDMNGSDYFICPWGTAHGTLRAFPAEPEKNE